MFANPASQSMETLQISAASASLERGPVIMFYHNSLQIAENSEGEAGMLDRVTVVRNRSRSALLMVIT